jgi:hypothetical protein
MDECKLAHATPPDVKNSPAFLFPISSLPMVSPFHVRHLWYYFLSSNHVSYLPHPYCFSSVLQMWWLGVPPTIAAALDIWPHFFPFTSRRC